MYRDTCNVIRYVSRHIHTDTATLRSTIAVVYWYKVCTFFYSICKSFNKIKNFVTPFGKWTINFTFILYTECTRLCVVKHVIHTIKTSKHDESIVSMHQSQQVLCTMLLLLNLICGSTKPKFKRFYTGIWITASNWHVVALWGHNRFLFFFYLTLLLPFCPFDLVFK